MLDVNPERDEAKRASLEEFVKLGAALERYYRGDDLWFDHAAFARDVDLFKAIFRAD
jgi:hypothetical protein